MTGIKWLLGDTKKSESHNEKSDLGSGREAEE